MRVYVVDNGGQWTHREWRVLRDLGVDTKIVPNTTGFDELDVDALVLSGGAPRVGSETEKLGSVGDYLNKAHYPILGICVSHQFMAAHFGGEAGPCTTPEFGKTVLFVLEEDELFKGLPKKFQVWVSHNDEVKSLPQGFQLLASSDNCKVQAMKSTNKPLYGVQFHPEVEHTEHGYDIFRNFLALCKR